MPLASKNGTIELTNKSDAHPSLAERVTHFRISRTPSGCVLCFGRTTCIKLYARGNGGEEFATAGRSAARGRRILNILNRTIDTVCPAPVTRLLPVEQPQPLADVVRSKAWQRTVAVLLVGVGFAFHQGVIDTVRVWATQADYSHGFLVPFVAAYLLYLRRHQFPPLVEWPEPWGLAPLVAGAAISTFAGTYNYAKEFGQGIGLILALTGVVLIVLGRPGLRWAWPGLAFLVFMVKMPDRIEILFAFKLRQIATQASNFLLQMLGYSSYIGGPGGTVISIGEVHIGVAWACSGLSMLLTFVAMGAAFALLMTKRPTSDRLLVFASSIPIAIISNILRITATALVYIAADNKDNFWKWLGDKIVHDLAGWLMMPLALGFMWLLLKTVDWLFVVPPPPERDDVLRVATQSAAANWVVPERTVNDDPDLAPKPKPQDGVPK